MEGWGIERRFKIAVAQIPTDKGDVEFNVKTHTHAMVMPWVKLECLIISIPHDGHNLVVLKIQKLRGLLRVDNSPHNFKSLIPNMLHYIQPQGSWSL